MYSFTSLFQTYVLKNELTCMMRLGLWHMVDTLLWV